MGLFDRIIRSVGGSAEPGGGAATPGRIVGIERKQDDDTGDRDHYAVEVPGPDGVARYGILVRGRACSRLPLGQPVLVRIDGGKATFDLEAMARAWGIADLEDTQGALRKAPADGIVDGALDWRVKRRLAKWTPSTGTIASLERRAVLGMASENWDLQLDLLDGTRALDAGDLVPPYAHQLAVPGATIPVVVDPGDPTKVAVDWPQAAMAAAQVERAFDAPVLEGSIAAIVTATSAPAAPVAGAGEAEPGSHRNPELTNATISAWLTTVQAGRMKPKAYHQAVRDWEAAGMCSPEEAAAAHAAVPEGA